MKSRMYRIWLHFKFTYETKINMENQAPMGLTTAAASTASLANQPFSVSHMYITYLNVLILD